MLEKTLNGLKLSDGTQLVSFIDIEHFQSFAESNFGRRLTPQELELVPQRFWDEEDAHRGICDAMAAVIKSIINT